MTQALFADCLKVTFMVACGWWWEEDGQVCVNIGKLSEGSYYKIGNLWLESVRSTKLGSERRQRPRLKGEEMPKESVGAIISGFR